MSSKRTKTILIVDDDATIKEALNLLLKEEGYVVYCLASGHNVDTWLDHNHADVILIDYLMPGLTGAEVTRRLRTRQDTKHTPIIMLAATRHYQSYGYDAGIDRFIIKPFDIDHLLRQIEYYLD